jgi:hypothetical protein
MLDMSDLETRQHPNAVFIYFDAKNSQESKGNHPKPTRCTVFLDIENLHGIFEVWSGRRLIHI